MKRCKCGCTALHVAMREVNVYLADDDGIPGEYVTVSDPSDLLEYFCPDCDATYSTWEDVPEADDEKMSWRARFLLQCQEDIPDAE